MPLAYDPDKRVMYGIGPDGQWAPTQMAVDPKGGKRYGLDPGSGQWTEVAEPEPGIFRQIDNVVRSIAKGATFGWADEIAAKADEWTGRRGAYDQNIAEERLRDTQARNENPILSTVGEIGGNVAGTLAAGGVARAIPGVSGVINTLGNLPRVLRYGGVGAAAGAAQGAGESEGGIAQRLPDAAVGAAVGGAVGAVVPTAVDIAKAGVRGVTNFIANQTAPQTMAARKLAERVAQDDMTPQRIAKRLEMLGPNATITDAGGPNVRATADALANEPGIGQRMATRVMGTRANSQGQRIVEAAREGLGARGEFYEQIDDLMRTRATQAAPLYEQAYRAGLMYSDDLAKMSERPSLKAALPRAVRIAGEEGVDPRALGFAVDAQGGVVSIHGPTAQTWDYIKRGLDDVLEAYRDKTTGKLALDTEGRAINDTRKALIAELDRLNPVYAQARAAWAGPTQAMDAMQRGRMFARGDEEVTQKIVQGLSPGDREFFREGVLREIQAMTDRGADGINKARQLVAVPKTREALKAVFPDEGSYRAFLQTLIGENRMALTKNAVLGGSQTAQRLANQGGLNTDAVGVVSEAVQGRPFGAFRAALNTVVDRFGKMPQEQRDVLSRMLFSTDPDVQAKALAAIGSQARMLGSRRVRDALVGTGLAGATGAQAGEYARPLLKIGGF